MRTGWTAQPGPTSSHQLHQEQTEPTAGSALTRRSTPGRDHLPEEESWSSRCLLVDSGKALLLENRYCSVADRVSWKNRVQGWSNPVLDKPTDGISNLPAESKEPFCGLKFWLLEDAIKVAPSGTYSFDLGQKSKKKKLLEENINQQYRVIAYVFLAFPWFFCNSLFWMEVTPWADTAGVVAGREGGRRQPELSDTREDSLPRTELIFWQFYLFSLEPVT